MMCYLVVGTQNSGCLPEFMVDHAIVFNENFEYEIEMLEGFGTDF